MKTIVGLGNPGRKYAATKHNIGFRVVDALAEAEGGDFRKNKQGDLVCKIEIAGTQVRLLKPQTFMNLSGAAVEGMGSFDPGNLIVVSDDFNLELAQIRIRRGGGDGGHKGLRSLIERIGTEAFPRVRIGVGKPAPGEDPAEFVLKPFRKADQAVIEDAVRTAADALRFLIEHGVDAAMNEYNRKKPEMPATKST